MGNREGMTQLAAGAALALLLALAVQALPAAAQPGKPSILAASPRAYIANWAQRAKSCSDLTSSTWTSWTTYAEATVGHEWMVTVSRKVGCDFAKVASDRLIESLPFNDGAGFRKTDWQGYALKVGEGRTDDPIGHDRPPGWKCFALPSAWGAAAWQAAEAQHSGAPNDESFGPASGPAAGAGYCVTGAGFDSKGLWHGGRFFTWAPDGQVCRARYHLKETPVPEQTFEVTYPSYGNAQIWSDYERQPC
jgi:hypothetical protein